MEKGKNEKRERQNKRKTRQRGRSGSCIERDEDAFVAVKNETVFIPNGRGSGSTTESPVLPERERERELYLDRTRVSTSAFLRIHDLRECFCRFIMVKRAGGI